METNKDSKTNLPPVAPCPDPMTVTLTAEQSNVVTADFNAAQLANYQGELGYNSPNKAYAHTFEWKPKTRCCQVTKAVLKVELKAIQRGASPKSADSGNDRIAIVSSGGVSIPPFNEPVYDPNGTFPIPAGTLATKIWSLQGSDLNKLNTAHTLSFFVQDDSSVLSATLVLTICCLDKIG